MQIQEAVAKAEQILDEERLYPTVRYTTDAPVLNAAAGIAQAFSERGKHPRTVQPYPEKFIFRSTNFDLMCALLDQVQEADRNSVLKAVISRISNEAAYHDRSQAVLGAGTSSRCSSELPLVVELAVRRGIKPVFIRALAGAAPSPGLTLLLLQLEEMIAFNFTLFTVEDYAQLRMEIGRLKKTIGALEKEPSPRSAVKSNTRHAVCREVPPLCESISEGCRKAEFLYLKGSLSRGMNLEVNQDKGSVRGFLEKLGFTPLLVQSLDEAERLYRENATPFDLKSSLGHLRSFLEQLHIQACAAARAKFGGSSPTRWGEALKYLQDNGVYTKAEESFVATFYTLLSDTGVHPLIAEPEYMRLMRIISIEYGLLLLTKLDKLS